MTVATERTWATGPEVYELVEAAHRRENPRTRFYPQVGNHAADLYDVLRKRVAAGARPDREGWYRITWGQCAADLYDGSDPLDVVNSRRKANSMRRWIERLAAAGLVQWSPATVGTGKLIGIRFRLLAVPALPSSASPRSSAGYSSGGVGRRRESRRERLERRVRPYCRRTGQKGVGRYGPAGPLFSPTTFGASRGCGPLRGPQPEEEMDACASGGAASVGPAPDWGRDAIQRVCPADARPALDRLRGRTAPVGEGEDLEGAAVRAAIRGSLEAARWTPDDARARLRAIRRAVEPGTPPVAVLLAGWEAVMEPGNVPALSRKAAGQLQRSAGQLDRLQGPGTTIAVLLDRLAAVDPRTGQVDGDAIYAARYFVAEVRAMAREARRYDRHRRGLRDDPKPRPHRPRGRH